MPFESTRRSDSHALLVPTSSLSSILSGFGRFSACCSFLLYAFENEIETRGRSTKNY